MYLGTRAGIRCGGGNIDVSRLVDVQECRSVCQRVGIETWRYGGVQECMPSVSMETWSHSRMEP